MQAKESKPRIQTQEYEPINGKPGIQTTESKPINLKSKFLKQPPS